MAVATVRQVVNTAPVSQINHAHIVFGGIGIIYLDDGACDRIDRYGHRERDARTT